MTHRSLIFSRMQLYLALPTREIEVWTHIHHIYSKIRAAQPHTDISTDPSHAHSLANGNQSWIFSFSWNIFVHKTHTTPPLWGSGSCSAVPKLGQKQCKRRGRCYLADTMAAAIIVAASSPCWWWPQKILGRPRELGRKNTRKHLTAAGKDWGEGGKRVSEGRNIPIGI